MKAITKLAQVKITQKDIDDNENADDNNNNSNVIKEH
jgi:hypothetical protein